MDDDVRRAAEEIAARMDFLAGALSAQQAMIVDLWTLHFTKDNANAATVRKVADHLSSTYKQSMEMGAPPAIGADSFMAANKSGQEMMEQTWKLIKNRFPE